MSDSPVMAFFNKAADLLLLNLIAIVCSLPVVTMGASMTAMYHVCITSIRQGDGYVVQRFLKEFKRSFGKATIAWVCMLLLMLVAAGDLLFWYKMGQTFGKIMFCISAIVIAALVFVGLWIFPVMAKFEDTLGKLVKNAAAFAYGYLPYTIIVLALDVLFVVINLKTIAANMVTILIGFALIAYVKSFFYYKVFMNHIDEKYDDFDREIQQDSSGDF